MLKFLHTSDWHLGKSLYDFSLLEDQFFFVNQLLNILEREKVDAVLLAGDIYDRPVPSAQAVQLYDHFLSKAVGDLGIPVIAIAGNHDSPSRLEFGSSLYRSSGYHITGIPQKEIKPVILRDKEGEVRFFPIPYLHPAEIRVLFGDKEVHTFDDAYRTLLNHNREAIDPGARNIALAHGFFSDLTGHASTALLTSDSEVNIGGMDIACASHFDLFDYVALGHLHAPQWTVRDRVRYSGTPLKYSLSEENQQKSATLITLGKKGDLSAEMVPIPYLRDVRTVRGSFEELREPSFHHSGSFLDYVFAEISGEETTYPMEKLRVLFPNLLGLSFVDTRQVHMPEIVSARARQQLSAEEMFRRFYRDILGEEINDEQLELVREALEEMTSEEVTV